MVRRPMFRDSADARCEEFVQEKSGRFGTPGEPIRRKGDWLESRYVERIEASKGPPLRMGRTSEEPTLRMESSSASDVKLAAVAEGLEHPESRRCGRLRVSGEPIQWKTERSGIRFGGGRNGKGANVVAGRLIWELIQRLRDWLESRFCGRNNGSRSRFQLFLSEILSCFQRIFRG